MKDEDGFEIVFSNNNGYAIHWFDNENDSIYRIFYNSKREPLATNSMRIIKEELGEQEAKPTLIQLSLF